MTKQTGLVRCSKWKECKVVCTHKREHNRYKILNHDQCGESECNATGLIAKCLPIPTKKVKAKKDYCKWNKREDLYSCGCRHALFGFFEYTFCPYCGKKIKLLKEASR